MFIRPTSSSSSSSSRIRINNQSGSPKPTPRSQTSNSPKLTKQLPPSTYEGPLFQITQLFYAIIPIALSVAIVGFEFDNEFWVLSLTFGYLFIFIKFPWDLYYASLPRNPINTVEWASQPIEPGNAAAEALRYQKSLELSSWSWFGFMLTFISPLVGGYILTWIRSYLSIYARYLTDFNIFLFVITCELRPLLHIFNSGIDRSNQLQAEVHYPNSLVDQLQMRIQQLEEEMLQLKKAYATKREVINMKEGFQPAFQYIGKMVQKSERKTDLYISYEEERYQNLEQKFNELNDLIIKLPVDRNYQSRLTSFFHSLYHLFMLIPNLIWHLVTIPFQVFCQTVSLIFRYSPIKSLI